MGTHQNRIDAKGRVSIPAPFRTALKVAEGRDAVKLVLRPSHNYPCVEAWPEPAFAALAAPLKSLDMFSEEYDELASALYVDAAAVEADKEGRISIPGDMAAHAGLSDAIVFMGFGERFLIWEPDAAEHYRQARRERQQRHRVIAPGVRVAAPQASATVSPPLPDKLG